MPRNQFYNPATGEGYPWPINHSDENSFGKARQVNTGANTANTGLTMQQGDDEPMVIEVTGTILHSAQHAAMIRWFAISKQQTIYFTDYSGDSYEVVILAYQPTRQRTLGNPRDRTMPFHYYKYTLRMHVVRILAGAWTQVTP
jgi:hypothetical protein